MLELIPEPENYQLNKRILKNGEDVAIRFIAPINQISGLARQTNVFSAGNSRKLII